MEIVVGLIFVAVVVSPLSLILLSLSDRLDKRLQRKRELRAQHMVVAPVPAPAPAPVPVPAPTLVVLKPRKRGPWIGDTGKTALIALSIIIGGMVIAKMFDGPKKSSTPIPTLEELNSMLSAQCRAIAGRSNYEYVACMTGGVTARQDYRN